MSSNWSNRNLATARNLIAHNAVDVGAAMSRSTFLFELLQLQSTAVVIPSIIASLSDRASCGKFSTRNLLNLYGRSSTYEMQNIPREPFAFQASNRLQSF